MVIAYLPCLLTPLMLSMTEASLGDLGKFIDMLRKQVISWRCRACSTVHSMAGHAALAGAGASVAIQCLSTVATCSLTSVHVRLKQQLLCA
jgi:hypothetical protein